jgi:membrane protease YdiL (CAAX protease family)
VSLALARRDPRRARRQLVLTWAICIGTLAVAKALSALDPTGIVSGNIAALAAFLFVALPERRIRREGERWADFGLPWRGAAAAWTWREWLRGARFALLVCAVVFPLFLGIFWGYGVLLPHLPAWLAGNVAPYAGAPAPRFRLPDRFALLALVQLLVVALPEELFYRGWMQTTWAASDPARRVRVLGASLGAGFLWTQALFALGHLVIPEAWRLGTFFPGLVFGWVRERSGGLAAPILVHALSNLFIATLEASFYG